MTSAQTAVSETQPLLSDQGDTGGSGGDGRQSGTIKYLPPKEKNEKFTSIVSRRGTGISGFIDIVGTIISAVMAMLSRTSSAAVDIQQLLGKDTSQATNFSNNINNDLAPKFMFVGGWGFFFSNFFYGLRILISGQGKQNRAGKIAFAFIGICGLLAGINALVIVGMTTAAAATAAFLAIPFLAIALNVGIILRWGIRLARTHAARDPKNLYKQKKEKFLLAIKADVKEREIRYKIEKDVIKWTLKKLFGTKEVNKKQADENAALNRIKQNANLSSEEKNLLKAWELPLSEEALYRQIAFHFNNYENFLAHLKLPSDTNEKTQIAADLALARTVQMRIDQENKFAGRRKFFIIGTILSSIFILNATLGFLITAATASTPLLILGTAALVGVKLASASLGIGVLACMIFFAVATIRGAINEYKKWVNDHALQLKGPFASDWKELHERQKAAMALRISGTATLLVSSLVIATIFLPFVFPALAPAVFIALITVAAVLLATSTGLMIAGTRMASKIHDDERALNEKEFKHSLGLDPEPQPEPTVSEALAKTGASAAKAPVLPQTTASGGQFPLTAGLRPQSIGAAGSEDMLVQTPRARCAC